MVSAQQRFLFLETEMKRTTRDNLVYLGIGVGIVALILTDFYVSDSHGLRMWWPSTFASRVAYTTGLLMYFVARETRKMKATVAQVFAYTLFATIVHLAIVFTFRSAAGELSGIFFSVLAVLEMFLVFQLLMVVVRYLRSG
jgi:hypothetical protein